MEVQLHLILSFLGDLTSWQVKAFFFFLLLLWKYDAPEKLSAVRCPGDGQATVYKLRKSWLLKKIIL